MVPSAVTPPPATSLPPPPPHSGGIPSLSRGPGPGSGGRNDPVPEWNLIVTTRLCDLAERLLDAQDLSKPGEEISQLVVKREMQFWRSMLV